MNLARRVKCAGGKWNAQEKVWEIPYGEVKTLGLTPLVLGIRPEHVKITQEPHEDSFEVNVSVVEYLGAETLVTFELSEDVSALASPNGFFPVKMGEKHRRASEPVPPVRWI